MPDSDSYNIALARSYLAYFIASLLGLFVDSITSVNLHIPHAYALATLCFGIGPALIIWAQYTSAHHKREKGGSYFLHGPYRLLRNPTQLGLLILVTGYTFISQSPFFFIMTLLGYVVSNMYFRKYEHLISEEHNEYESYKSSVRKIL